MQKPSMKATRYLLPVEMIGAIMTAAVAAADPARVSSETKRVTVLGASIPNEWQLERFKERTDRPDYRIV